MISPDLSSIYLHDTKQGYYILLLHNVCYDFNSNNMLLYVKDEKDVDLSAIPKGNCAILSFLFSYSPILDRCFWLVVFPSGWGFRLRAGQTFPNHPTTITDINSYMLIPHSSRNIAHYMEVYNVIYHIIHEPHRYPRVSLFLCKYIVILVD